MAEEISSGIIVFHDKKYLILHYEQGHWDFPKGHVEENESLEQAARRETKEETNLDIGVMPGFREEISYFFRNKKKELIRKKVIFFIGRSETGDVRLSDEHIGYEWLTYDEAVKRLTYKTARDVLEKANAMISSLSR